MRHGKVIELVAFERPPTAAARVAARHYGRITVAATARPVSAHPQSTTLRCRRRPEGRACRGTIFVLRPDVPPEIRWWCPVCEDRGVIRRWQGTVWDLISPNLCPEEIVDLSFDLKTYRLIEGMVPPSAPAGRLVAGARLDGERVRLCGSRRDVDSLARLLSPWLSSEPRPGRRARLQAALCILTDGILAKADSSGIEADRRRRP